MADHTTTLFFNGNIITMNPDMPKATAFAVSNGRFSVVGTDSQVQSLFGSGIPKVDLKGKTVLPGFIESHNHISIYAANQLQADCTPGANNSIENIKKRIQSMAEETPDGQWIRGWGYDDTLIGDKRHLTCIDLDEASSKHPILIAHVSGHLAYVNSMALKIADVGPDTPQPEGGTIHKDSHGNPTGLLMEPSAMNLITRYTRAYTKSQLKKVLLDAMEHYNRFGITSTHDAALGYQGSCREECRAYRELETEGCLSLRVYMTIMEHEYNAICEHGLGTGFGSEFLKIGSVKMFQDGSIQAMTGALSKDYHNKKGFRGELIHPQETLEQLVVKFHNQDLQIAVHANGDRAIESVIQAFEKAQEQNPRSNHRHMLIHCQMASLDHIKRMKTAGIVPSYFVNHVYYWGDRHCNLFLGPDRARDIDPLGFSLNEGLIFSLHSDLPVTPVDPIFSIHNAVNRVTRKGLVLGEEQRIPVLEALKAYTINAAYCSFEEDIKGSIETGKLADFTVLSDDPLTIVPENIKDIQVRATAVGGKKVFGSFN